MEVAVVSTKNVGARIDGGLDTYRGMWKGLLVAAAVWPVWRWYILRVTDGSDEPWGVVALLSATVVILWQYQESHRKNDIYNGFAASTLLCYVLLYDTVPPLARAILAACALWLTVAHKVRSAAALGILIALSLPIVSSLEFFLGYPIRFVLAHCTAQIVSLMNNQAVVAQGTLLTLSQRVVALDAPCSGIRMLWVGLFIAALTANIRLMPLKPTLSIVFYALRVIFLCNLLRSVCLFYKESGLVALPDWTHEGIGLVCFALASVCIIRRGCIYEG